MLPAVGPPGRSSSPWPTLVCYSACNFDAHSPMLHVRSDPYSSGAACSYGVLLGPWPLSVTIGVPTNGSWPIMQLRNSSQLHPSRRRMSILRRRPTRRRRAGSSLFFQHHGYHTQSLSVLTSPRAPTTSFSPASSQHSWPHPSPHL